MALPPVRGILLSGSSKRESKPQVSSRRHIKTATTAEIIFDVLRRATIEGELTGGESLRQDEIAKAFNTSRFPVREALTRL